MATPRSVLDRTDGVLDRMKRASDKVEERLDRATASLQAAEVAYAVVGGNAIAAWVATVDESAARGTPNVDLMVHPEDVGWAVAALSTTFDARDGLSFGENPSALARSAVRLWPMSESLCDVDALSRAVVLEGVPTVALEDLVRAKLALWRTVDMVHLRDLIGTELVPIGLVDASWLPRFPAPLAARLKELLDDPNG